MHRIDSDGAAVGLPAPGAVGSTVGYFTDGDPGTGVPATVVSADWLNALQEEVAYVIEQAGLTLDKTVRTQLRSAISILAGGVGAGILSKTFADTGYTAVIASKIVKWTTTGGACVQNLPVASTCVGQIWTFIKMTGDANAVTITPNGAETINGDASLALDTQWSVARVMSISTGWILL